MNSVMRIGKTDMAESQGRQAWEDTGEALPRVGRVVSAAQG